MNRQPMFKRSKVQRQITQIAIPVRNLEPLNLELLNGRYCGFGLTHGFSSRLYKIPERKNITTSPQSIGS